MLHHSSHVQRCWYVAFSPHPSNYIEKSSVEEAAAAILALINSRSRTPPQHEIESIITKTLGHAGADPSTAPDGNLADLTFEPVLGGDGKPISFGYTDYAFIQAMLPTVRLAFVTVTKTKAELTQIVRELLEDDVQDVLDAMESYDDVGKKLRSLADICNAAFARTVVVAEPLEDERLAKLVKEVQP